MNDWDQIPNAIALATLLALFVGYLALQQRQKSKGAASKQHENQYPSGKSHPFTDSGRLKCDPIRKAKTTTMEKPLVDDICMLGADELAAILSFLPIDNYLAFSMTCHHFNTARKSHGLSLRTSIAWVLSSPSAEAWAEQMGCPPPYPQWGMLHGLKDLQYNKLVVKVLRKPNAKGRQAVKLHASLSSPEMLRSTPHNRVEAIEGRGELLRPELQRGILVKPVNIHTLQPSEVARVEILYFSEEVLVPKQRRRVNVVVEQLIRERAEFTARANQNEFYCQGRVSSKTVLGTVGGEMRLTGGLTSPRMSGVELLLQDILESEGGSPRLEIIGGRPFEILEILQPYLGAPSLAEALTGQVRVFHARVRWIPSLPQYTGGHFLPPEYLTREFL